LKALILCCEPYRYGVRREVDETSSRFYKCWTLGSCYHSINLLLEHSFRVKPSKCYLLIHVHSDGKHSKHPAADRFYHTSDYMIHRASYLHNFRVAREYFYILNRDLFKLKSGFHKCIKIYTTAYHYWCFQIIHYKTAN
jgi:hypothetical protein